MSLRIGILGAGQLGRMLALAGYPLGIRFNFFDPTAESPARELGCFFHGSYDDQNAIDRFLDQCDLVTFEFENIPLNVLTYIESKKKLFPSARALEVSQDRWVEKTIFNQLEIPTPAFFKVEHLDDLKAGIKAVGFPAILKTRRLGYDGKGQVRIETQADIATSFVLLGQKDLILEEYIPFEREFSIIAVRNRQGEACFYPLTENVHEKGILRVSRAPSEHATPELFKIAQTYAQKLLDELSYCGVFALELFQKGSQLLANEMAPRVHNSGHWSIDGASCSQFENHLRAILGLPLGACELRAQSAMVNIISKLPELRQILKRKEARLHLYDKFEREGRKLGHINLVCSDQTSLIESIEFHTKLCRS